MREPVPYPRSDFSVSPDLMSAFAAGNRLFPFEPSSIPTRRRRFSFRFPNSFWPYSISLAFPWNFTIIEYVRKKLSYILVFALYPILGMVMGGAWGAFWGLVLSFIFFALAIAGLWLVNWLFKPSPSIYQILGWLP